MTAERRITPFLWFDGKAEEAAEHYVSIFPGSRIGSVSRYGEAAAKASGQPAGSAMTVAFELEGQPFVALNGGPHFRFTEAISFVVNCDSQEEIDRYWEALSAGGDPSAQRCGWLKDRYGVSWQVVPRALGSLLQGPAAGRVMQALLQMTKPDLARLQQARDGK